MARMWGGGQGIWKIYVFYISFTRVLPLIEFQIIQVLAGEDWKLLISAAKPRGKNHLFATDELTVMSTEVLRSFQISKWTPEKIKVYFGCKFYGSPVWIRFWSGCNFGPKPFPIVGVVVGHRFGHFVNKRLSHLLAMLSIPCLSFGRFGRRDRRRRGFGVASAFCGCFAFTDSFIAWDLLWPSWKAAGLSICREFQFFLFLTIWNKVYSECMLNFAFPRCTERINLSCNLRINWRHFFCKLHKLWRSLESWEEEGRRRNFFTSFVNIWAQRRLLWQHHENSLSSVTASQSHTNSATSCCWYVSSWKLSQSVRERVPLSPAVYRVLTTNRVGLGTWGMEGRLIARCILLLHPLEPPPPSTPTTT